MLAFSALYASDDAHLVSDLDELINVSLNLGEESGDSGVGVERQDSEIYMCTHDKERKSLGKIYDFDIQRSHGEAVTVPT